MKEDTQTLNDVVVVGFAKQKKANMTGAVSSVKMDDIIGVRPIATTGSLLQGVAPGLQVTQDTGEPGGGSSFNIRGTTSINGGSPLILVDNVYYNGPLNMLNPNDIESVTVLKDASSASIYGARSAFGVILITTKGAQKGQKVQLTYNNNFTFSRPSSLPEKASPLQTVQAYKDMGYITYYSGQTVDTWLDLLHDYQANPKAYSNGYAEVDGMRYQLAESDVLGDFMSETGFQQKHDLTASGGSDDISYRMSLGYVSNDGIMVTDRDNYKRYNGRAFISGKITDWLTAQVDFTFSKQDKNMPSGANYQKAVQQASYAPTGMININGEDMISGVAANLVKAGGDNKTGYTDSRIFAKLIATPLKGLTLNAEFTYDHLNYNVTNFTKRVVYANADKFSEDSTGDNSTYYRNKEMTNYTALNIYGTYNKVFSEKHNFTVMLGYNLENSYKEGLSVTASEMINDELPSISQSVGEKKPDDSFNEFSILGFFGRLNYTYKERYLLELSGRADASSKFPRGSRWGFFPSVSAGWRVSSEQFFANSVLSNYISNLKFRVSYGEMGNDDNYSSNKVLGIGDWDYMYGYNMNAGTGVIASDPFISSSGSTIGSVSQRGMPVTNLSWVKSSMLNIGVDLGFLNNRLTLEVDGFMRKRSGLTDRRGDVYIPYETGYSEMPLENLNTDKHIGIDGLIKWQDNVGREFYYSVGFNATLARKKNGNVYGERFGNSWEQYRKSGQNRWSYVNWGYEVIGRFQTQEEIDAYPVIMNISNGSDRNKLVLPGDLIYKDQNGDGVINDYDSRPIGYAEGGLPYMTYGLNLACSYKGFDIAIDFAGAALQSFQRNWETKWPFQAGNTFNYMVEDRWHHEDPLDPSTPWVSGNYPALRPQSVNAWHVYCNNSTYWLTNAAYFRMKNLEIGYTIPQKITQKIAMQKFRVFFNGTNLFSIDNTSKFGLDPENSDTNGLGYPMVRVLTFGATITF